MQRFWYAWEPGQRTWVDRRELWEAPVEDGGHVACGFEVASGGGGHHVAEWVFTGFGRQREQVGPEGWPGRFGGESDHERLAVIPGQNASSQPRDVRRSSRARSCKSIARGS
jgi:hypothetical protein